MLSVLHYVVVRFCISDVMYVTRGFLPPCSLCTSIRECYSICYYMLHSCIGKWRL